MFEMVPLKKEHVEQLVSEEINHHLKPWLESGVLDKMLALNTPNQFAGFVGEDLVYCGGLIELWTGRAYWWSVLGEKMKFHPLASFRGIRKFLETQPYNRIEMDTAVGNEVFHKRALALGFGLECGCARKYSPGGNDAAIYAWVRD